ncbi:MAG: methyltransferase [Dokdonella sp.]
MSARATNPALETLFLPFSAGDLTLPNTDRVLFLGARDGVWQHPASRDRWVCVQSFKPFADELTRAGLQVAKPAADEKFPLVLVLPPRQRDESRAVLARALAHVAPGGIVVACVANHAGARSSEADLARLAGPVQTLSKHHCRVFWAVSSEASAIDQALLAEWLVLDAVRPIADGRYVSRPGLFAWDRIDPASALLVSQLPATLSGRVADLGAGYGYLAAQIVPRCVRVSAIDLYEAEARALDPARINMRSATIDRGDDVSIDVIWHDVTTGIPYKYDAIVSNPPFHQGREDQPELGRAFIVAAANALLPTGQFWMVANRHLAYEETLARHFRNVREVIVQDGFKVVCAREPRR